MNAILIAAAVLLTLAGCFLLLWSRQLLRISGLPAGTVLAADTSGWRRCRQPLWSDQHRLSGRPDYLLQTRGSTIPVEVKSGCRPSPLYRSHILQLAAYCLLAEETSGHAVPHGLLRYDDATVLVEFTPALRHELLATLNEMRRSRSSHTVERSHEERSRCAGCGVRHACDQRLEG